jgi:hypothetical protein
MLEGYELFKALELSIGRLQLQLGNVQASILHVCGADLFYSTGRAVGSYFKIMPFGFYYDMYGRPHYGCVGGNYELYGAAIGRWIAAASGGLVQEPTSVWV